jgi:hypothetical protein
MIRRDFRIFRRDFLTEFSQVVQVRAEGPKVPEAARPERAEAPSPGQRPGYDGNQQDALKGQKLYVLPGVLKLLPLQGDRFASVITQGDALG